MRLETLVEMRIEILDGQSSDLFSNEPFEKSPVMTIEDFVLHSDDHFESHLLGNGLYPMHKYPMHKYPTLSQSLHCAKTPGISAKKLYISRKRAP